MRHFEFTDKKGSTIRLIAIYEAKCQRNKHYTSPSRGSSRAAVMESRYMRRGKCRKQKQVMRDETKTKIRDAACDQIVIQSMEG